MSAEPLMPPVELTATGPAPAVDGDDHAEHGEAGHRRKILRMPMPCEKRLWYFSPYGNLLDVLIRLSPVPVMAAYLAVSLWFAATNSGGSRDGSRDYVAMMSFWGVFRSVLNAQVLVFSLILLVERYRALQRQPDPPSDDHNSHGTSGGHDGGHSESNAGHATEHSLTHRTHEAGGQNNVGRARGYSNTAPGMRLLWDRVLRLYCAFDVVFMLICLVMQIVFNLAMVYLSLCEAKGNDGNIGGLSVFSWAPILDIAVHIVHSLVISYALRVDFVGRSRGLPTFAINMLICNNTAMAVQNVFFIMNSLTSLDAAVGCSSWKWAFDVAIYAMPFTVELRIHYIMCLMKIRILDHEKAHVEHLCGHGVSIGAKLWRSRAWSVMAYCLWLVLSICYCTFLSAAFPPAVRPIGIPTHHDAHGAASSDGHHGEPEESSHLFDPYMLVVSLICLVGMLSINFVALKWIINRVKKNPGSSKRKDAGFVTLRQLTVHGLPVLYTVAAIFSWWFKLTSDEAGILWGFVSPLYPVLCIILYIRLFRAISRRHPVQMPVVLSFEDKVLLACTSGQLVLRMMEVLALMWGKPPGIEGTQLIILRLAGVSKAVSGFSDCISIVAVMLLKNIPKWDARKLDRHIALIMAAFSNLIGYSALTGIFMANAETKMHLDHHGYLATVGTQYTYENFYGSLGKSVQTLLFPIRIEFSLLQALFSVNLGIRFLCSVGAYCDGKICQLTTANSSNDFLSEMVILDTSSPDAAGLEVGRVIDDVQDDPYE